MIETSPTTSSKVIRIFNQPAISHSTLNTNTSPQRNRTRSILINTDNTLSDGESDVSNTLVKEEQDAALSLDFFAAVASQANPLPTSNPDSKPISRWIIQNSNNMNITASPPIPPIELDRISSLIKQRLSQLQKQGLATFSSSPRQSVHNFCERRRRDNIREAFGRLHRLIFEIEGGGDTPIKLSKMETLKRSIDNIERLRESVHNLQSEILLLKQIKDQMIRKQYYQTNL